MTIEQETEMRLVYAVARFTHDPLGFVKFAFPWGEGELAGKSIKAWQADVLKEIGEGLANGVSPDDAIRNANTVVQQAVASGHGIGKSALVAWIIYWALSTMVDARGVVTAMTDRQLRNKTWPEVSKWHRFAINKHWFVCTTTAIFSAQSDHSATWRCDAIPWSKENSEAFAGLHNAGKRVFLIFDEASAIDDIIWEVSEGALTDANTELVWCVFGNPTLNTGRFRECFGRLKHRWRHRQIDSRTVEGINLPWISKLVEDNGEDSDTVRIRVRGVFPRKGVMQFISSEVIAEAVARKASPNMSDPVVLGVDVARFGDDESVLCYRCGRDAKTIKMRIEIGTDTMQLAAIIVESVRKVAEYGIHVDMIFIDETGVGGGVVDRVRQLGTTCIGVNNGASSDYPVVEGSGSGELVANKGAECWARMRLWLKGGSIPDDQDLVRQLEGRQYTYNANNEIVLESKKDMKKRGLDSPDRADALALTFAFPVAARDHNGDRTTQTTGKALSDFDPLAQLRKR